MPDDHIPAHVEAKVFWDVSSAYHALKYAGEPVEMLQPYLDEMEGMLRWTEFAPLAARCRAILVLHQRAEMVG